MEMDNEIFKKIIDSIENDDTCSAVKLVDEYLKKKNKKEKEEKAKQNAKEKEKLYEDIKKEVMMSFDYDCDEDNDCDNCFEKDNCDYYNNDIDRVDLGNGKHLIAVDGFMDGIFEIVDTIRDSPYFKYEEFRYYLSRMINVLFDTCDVVEKKWYRDEDGNNDEE